MIGHDQDVFAAKLLGTFDMMPFFVAHSDQRYTVQSQICSRNFYAS